MFPARFSSAWIPDTLRTLSIAQMSAAVIGYLMYLLLGPGYLTADTSMIIAIAVMIGAKAMHPPAVSSAMIFAFQYTKPNTLMLFISAVVLIVILIGLQRASHWLIR
ncbi:HPP family protein [Chitinophagaceae bacterium LB-8]|uniref:HPP family protein n=1 Tax=Paraflavisolibacter caeni TaxID=2982496 RepID=A0A9X2XUH5_9BACT|nr:HPP family protein [Paraflavisolibacter caeni]MCU7549281.1 HPP family protein [Paraflavisolibacter caeni]